MDKTFRIRVYEDNKEYGDEVVACEIRTYELAAFNVLQSLVDGLEQSAKHSGADYVRIVIESNRDIDSTELEVWRNLEEPDNEWNAAIDGFQQQLYYDWSEALAHWLCEYVKIGEEE